MKYCIDNLLIYFVNKSKLYLSLNYYNSEKNVYSTDKFITGTKPGTCIKGRVEKSLRKE